MIATVLILDLFDQIEFWKNIQEIDLVYGVLDFVSHPTSKTKHQDITIPSIAIDLFDQIIAKGLLKFNFIANGVPASLVALQLASLLRGRDDLELCKMCFIGGSFVPPSRGLLMQSLYHVKNPRDFLGLLLSPDYLSNLSKQDSTSLSLKESSFSKSFLEDSFSARNHADCRLDQIADAIQEFSMPFEQIQLLTSIPLLLLHGEIDKMVDMSFSVALHDQWLNSEIHIFPRAGHWIHIENSQKVLSLIRKWGIST